MKTTARTLEYFRKKGVAAGQVERRLPHTNTTKDLFSIIDIIAISSQTTVGVQACGTDVMEHVDKLMKQYPEETRAWLDGPRELYIYAWRKLKLKRGGKAVRWTPRIIEVRMTANKELFWTEL